MRLARPWLKWPTCLTRAKRYRDAAACYRRLGGEFADVVCRNGQTERQLVAALPASGEVHQLLHVEPVWPSGRVEVREQSSSAAFAGQSDANLANDQCTVR